MKPALIVVFIAFAATLSAGAFLIRRQELRIRELESTVARQSTPEAATELVRRAGIEPGSHGAAGGAASTGPGASGSTEKEIAARTAQLEERIASMEKTALARRGTGSLPSDEELDAAVAKKVEEKLGEQKKNEGPFGEDKKRPMTEISKDLELTPQQEDQMVQMINDSKRAMFAEVSVPRNDGTNIVDDIVAALQDPVDPKEKAQAVFMKLFSDKIPGTDETYIARIMKSKAALNEQFKTVLTPEQMKKYERLGQDPHEIQTGYDPFEEYVAERLGKK